MSKTTVHPLPRHPEIILALNVMSTDPPRFHWYFFVPKAEDAAKDVQDGLKFHAVTDGSPSPTEKVWSFDATTTALATSEGGLAVAVVVGRLGGDDRTPDDLRRLLARIPMGVVPEADRDREPAFSCRVWIREALRRMHTEGYVDCPDVDAMEGEMWDRGRAAAATIEDDTFVLAKLVPAAAFTPAHCDVPHCR